MPAAPSPLPAPKATPEPASPATCCPTATRIALAPKAISPIFTYPYAQRAPPSNNSPAQRPRPRHGISCSSSSRTGGFPSRPSGPSCSCCLPDPRPSLSHHRRHHLLRARRRRSTKVDPPPIQTPLEGARCIVVPSWYAVSHSAGAESICQFSDRPAQQSLGLWREQNSMQTTKATP